MINGLSDLLHPVQALADYFTLWERRGSLDGLKMAYIGDGNNVCHELLFGAVKFGMTMAVACPEGYDPNPLVVKSAAREAQKVGTPAPVVTRDPMEAAAGADVVYTDVWTSMGQEEEAEARVQAFQGYMVSAEMMAAAGPEAVFMHCLPAHRGEEVAAERHRRTPVGGVRRGREPPPRPEGRPHPDARLGVRAAPASPAPPARP